MTDEPASGPGNPLDGLLGYAPARLAELPVHLQPGLMRYIEHGLLPGDGLQRILRNDPVFDVVPHLDEDSFAGLPAILRFLYSYAPSACWGAGDLVENWSATGGLRGYAERRGLPR